MVGKAVAKERALEMGVTVVVVVDQLEENEFLPEDQVANIAAQILLALNYIHEHGIVHRDLKLETFMLAAVSQQPASSSQRASSQPATASQQPASSSQRASSQPATASQQRASN